MSLKTAKNLTNTDTQEDYRDIMSFTLEYLNTIYELFQDSKKSHYLVGIKKKVASFEKARRK